MNTSEIERKKQKKLDKSHWMCRIQKYTFGIDAPNYYMGYCPFFWMTWVCLLFSPIALLYKALLKPILVRLDKFFEGRRKVKYITRQEYLKTPLEPTQRQLVRIAAMVSKDRLSTLKREGGDWAFVISYYTSMSDYDTATRLGVWFRENPNWAKTHLPAAKKFVEEQDKKLADIKLLPPPKWTMKNVVKVASLCGSLVFKILIPCVILVCAVGIYFGIAYIAAHITLAIVACTIAWLLSGAAAFVLFCILHSIYDQWQTARDKRKREEYRNRKYEEPVVAKRPGFISNLFTFIKDTIAITYKQECPLIIWGDETGSIEKRKADSDVGLLEES